MFALRKAWAAAALLAATSTIAAAGPPGRVTLSYPAHMRARIAAHGRTYVATLEPLPDAWRDLSGFRLNLVRVGDRRGRNLLNPGFGHGPEPYYFEAGDLAERRPGGATFSNPRSIPIAGTRDELEIEVVDVRVHPTRTELRAAFEALRLTLRIRRQ